jgi:hypothetical protein
MRFRAFAALLLLSSSHATVLAQDAATLTVRVRVESGEPLSNALVSVSETGDNRANVLTRTKDDGSLSVTVPRGTYAVTVYAAAARGVPSDLVDRILYGFDVTADRAVDIVVERGTVVQTCIVSEDGRPLAGARVDVVPEVNEALTSTYADDAGWVRAVLRPGMQLYVVPPPAARRERVRWVRFEDLVVDPRGIAQPIVLEALPEPDELDENRVLVYRGRAPGPHITIGFIGEGFTDGDEQFDDTNGNGVCDDEPYIDMNGSGGFDAVEPYVDANENGRRDAEPFTDANGDGVCNRGERAQLVEAAVYHVRTMLGFPAYRELAERIDAYALFVPSRQAGSDFPTLPVPVERDTAFGSVFRSTNFILDYDREGTVAEARRLLPAYDYLALVVNDLFGVGREGGGGVVVLFGGRVARLAHIAAHEFGHTIGGLADEYFQYDGSPPYNRDEPNYPNVTRTSAVSSLKWSRFVRPGTQVPTVDGTPGIGAFEGGYYRRYGIARPSFNCLMRKPSIFCAVCAESVTTRFEAKRGAGSPSAPTLALPIAGETVYSTLRVAVDVPDLAGVASVQAFVDGHAYGTPTAVAPFGLELDARPLPDGGHRVRAAVRMLDGRVVETAEVSIVVGRASPSSPAFTSARFKGGTLVLEGVSGAVVPGAVVFVDGTDRFALEPVRDGTLRVPKATTGSATALRISKAIRKNRPVTLQVVAPDGGRSPETPFVR